MAEASVKKTLFCNFCKKSQHDVRKLIKGERWSRLKYECIYLNAFETGSEARTGIGRWIGYYNADRPHSVFGGRTPDEVYATQATEEKLAA